MKYYQQSRLKLSNRILQGLLGLSVLVAGSVSGSAQSADEIVKRAATALGGEKSLKAIKSRQLRGKITDLKDGSGGSYQATSLQPNLYSVRYDLRGLEISAGYSGKSGWMRDSKNGLRTLTGAASRDFQAEVMWRNYRWFNYQKEKSKLSFAGRTTINDQPVNTVVLTTTKNVKIKLYFATGTNLLVREEFPAGEQTKTFDYSDFRKVDDVLEPHVITAAIGEEHFKIQVDRILHNLSLDRLAFDFPKISNEPLPDIAALLKDVKANQEQTEKLLEKYTYTEVTTKRELDDKGQLREKEVDTYDLTFYKGYRIRRLIAKNGQPLSADDDADETKKIEKRIREIEKKETEKEKKALQDREEGKDTDYSSEEERDQRVSIADVLRVSKLINPRRESFRDRDVIVFDFEPLPDYKPRTRIEKLFGKMAGAVWIDAAGKQAARVEARLIDSYKIGGGMVASLKEGATFVLEQEYVNNEVWLPTRADLNLGVKVFLLKGLNFNQVSTFGNYKRFDVETDKEKLKDPSSEVSEEKAAKP